MPRLSIPALKERMKAAWEMDQQWASHLASVYSLSCPGRNKFQNEFREGEEIGNDIFDSTLEHSLNRLANRVVAELFPPFQEWARFTPGTTAQMMKGPELDQLESQLEAATAVVMASLKNTNFAQAVHECILDFAHGTGVMLVLESDPETGSLLDFVAVNPAEVAVDHGPHGRIWGIFRKHKMKPQQVRETWADASNFPEDFEQKLKEPYSPNNKVELEEAFYFSQDSGKWYMDVIMKAPSETGMVRIVERDYDTTRWLTPRWSRFTGESRGRGPVLQAYHTARTLNKAKELLLINGSIQLQPPISYIDDGVFNIGNFDLSPLSLNAVGYNRGGPRGATLEPMDLGGDLNLAQFIFEEMQMDIKKIMLDDQLPPEAGAVRSATEWTARQKELADSKQAPFARFFAEFTRPLMGILLDIHQKVGLIDKNLRLDGHITEVQVTSPFAQAQNIDEVSSMSQFIELISPLGPELLNMRVKVENVPEYYARRMGLPLSEVVRPDEEVEAMMQQAAQMEQEQAELEHQRVMEENNGGASNGVASPRA